MTTWAFIHKGLKAQYIPPKVALENFEVGCSDIHGAKNLGQPIMTPHVGNKGCMILRNVTSIR